jgi:acyl-CoA thioesterase-1
MFARKRIRRLAPVLALALGWACTGCGTSVAPTAGETHGDPGDSGEAASAEAGEASAAGETGPLVVFLGDSLTAGYGLPEDSAFPEVIGRTLRAEGQPIRVVNAGTSGDTSAGGLSRLPWLLKQQPDVLVVGLGGNDGLRGLPPASTRDNLERIVEAAQAQGALVLLLGLRMPPNYGPDYTAEFERLYADVADELDVPLVPFMLEGVAGDPGLNQGDGIHPTAKGQEIVAGNVLPALRPLLEASR